MGKEEDTKKGEEAAKAETVEENAIKAVEDAAAAAVAAAEAEAAINNARDGRDCLLLLKDDGEDAKDIKMSVYLQDMIYFQRVLRKLEGKEAPNEEAELDELAERIVKFLKEGKPYELAGLKGVPFPFLNSSGQILTKEGTETAELSDEDAKNLLRKKLFDEFKKEEGIGSLDESPYKEFKELMQRKVEPSTKENPVIPNSRDTLLLPCNDKSTEKLYEHQSGNKVVFNLASQLVGTNTTDTESRIEAALHIINNFDAAEIPLQPDEKPPASKIPRFLARGICEKPEDVVWEHLSAADIAEFVLGFVFEVVLEKEIALLPSKSSSETAAPSSPSTEPSTEPVSDPTDYDVLFGRGGMTNSHPGNRRFRDVIALHRPDYIRAIKMDKPAVAKKIVKAIRQGTPPGRFMKKGEDGLWHDVGDRTAAEKTSQGLRERSNAEKRQRSELRRALRIRKEDLQEDEGTPSAKKAKVENSAASATAAASTAAALTPTLNYVGTNLAVPLSLNMTTIVGSGSKKKSSESKGKASSSGVSELNTEGLPPNAVDEEGNILVTDYDILCGRGGLTNHHKGNKRFRDIVALHRPDYVRAPKIQKPSVARVIVRAIRNGDPPGRFLRKDEKTGKWIDIGDKKAAEKTSQALREKSNEERDTGGGKRDPNAVGVLLPNPASYLANPSLATTTASVMGNILASTVDPPKTEDGEKSKENEESAKEGEKKEEDNTEKKEEGKEDPTKPEAVENPELPKDTANQQTASV